MQCREKPADDPYNWTHFAHELCGAKDINPLPSDSRRRPDRYLLETGKSSEAAVASHNLEMMQRAERKERERKSVEHKPRWFRPAPADKAQPLPTEYPAEECPFWEFTGDFLKADPRPACSEGEVTGKGFVPWAFPALHGAMIGNETRRV
jgi:Oxysterol-binding protein